MKRDRRPDLIEAHDQVLHRVVLGVMGGHGGGRQGSFKVRVAVVAIGAAQVAGEEAEVVDRENEAVPLRRMIRQDACNFLRELDEVAQVSQLLTYACHT